jgi:hypothetical protein
LEDVKRHGAEDRKQMFGRHDTQKKQESPKTMEMLCKTKVIEIVARRDL